MYLAIFRPKTNHTCHRKPNPSRETVPFSRFKGWNMLITNLPGKGQRCCWRRGRAFPAASAGRLLRASRRAGCGTETDASARTDSPVLKNIAANIFTIP
jgi:hypothetical protein